MNLKQSQQLQTIKTRLLANTALRHCEIPRESVESWQSTKAIVIVSERSERGNPQIHTPLSSLRASRKTCVAKQGEAEVSLVIHKKGKDIDCHESLRDSRNDEKAAYNDERLTHTHNAKSANNDKSIVIASKSQDLRGNLCFFVDY